VQSSFSKYKLSFSNPCTGLRVLRVSGGSDSQISRQSAHEGGKAVSPTHRSPLPPGNIPGTHFCWRLSRPQDNNAAGRIVSMKNFNNPIGNRTRAVPHPSAPPRPPNIHNTECKSFILRYIYLPLKFIQTCYSVCSLWQVCE